MGIKEQMESILLLGGDEVKIRDLSKFFSISVEKVFQILEELKLKRFNTGINIEIDQEIVYLTTNPRCGEIVNMYFKQDVKPKKLSNAALETLSIIAYRQPITKSEIEAVRGVSIDRVVQTLEERKFIYVCGKKEAIGKPNLYAITDKFLGYLGISSVEELPQYENMKEKLNGTNENK
ncbi:MULTISPECIES: SMC-Scp complex subunit ScpB [Cetobacterium]|uniref:SMC-Scp complex subunit ScpB n=1 Tax=Candidatus Cetobacterium colombiensis TaxID=3073100 RepID=A0ABU4W8B5_9FUSO|nr:SMC-Scp complex subunit ScpB [Candidatus Cetobacterium colombiensis]MDX8335771.1 SMC-Scp complex subunit ScpB [Candidatus Cetobacterium colombiensis]